MGVAILNLISVCSCVDYCVRMSGRKRNYLSGSKKRKEKEAKIAKSVKNTKSLSSYFGVQRKDGESSSATASSSMLDDSDASVNGSDEEDSLMVVDSEISVSNEIEETSNECKGGEEEDLIIRVSENEDVQEDVDVTESVVLNLNNEYPTDRGILPSDVKDPVRLAIIEHGPCRPQCSL